MPEARDKAQTADALAQEHLQSCKDALCYGAGYVHTEPELLDEPIDAAIAAIQRDKADAPRNAD